MRPQPLSRCAALALTHAIRPLSTMLPSCLRASESGPMDIEPIAVPQGSCRSAVDAVVSGSVPAALLGFGRSRQAWGSTVGLNPSSHRPIVRGEG